MPVLLSSDYALIFAFARILAQYTSGCSRRYDGGCSRFAGCAASHIHVFCGDVLGQVCVSAKRLYGLRVVIFLSLRVNGLVDSEKSSGFADLPLLSMVFTPY